jgi:hypothetical protein
VFLGTAFAWAVAAVAFVSFELAGQGVGEPFVVVTMATLSTAGMLTGHIWWDTRRSRRDDAKHNAIMERLDAVEKARWQADTQPLRVVANVPMALLPPSPDPAIVDIMQGVARRVVDRSDKS